MIYSYIEKLVEYGLTKGLVKETDRIFVINSILDTLNLDDFEEVGELHDNLDLEEILKNILDWAVENNIIEDGITSRDLFDTKLMGLLTPRPSEVIDIFEELYAENPQRATDYFYDLSVASDYIRKYRIVKDKKWVYPSVYGDLDITINLSKPEKDPKAIAAAKNQKQSGYPKCLLCKENLGYRGRMNHPARQNIRTIPTTINGEDWYFQYSPYVYYNEHCIVFKGEHEPMKIDRTTFRKLLDFVKTYPHYFVGSNADLPIVGGSILTHDHFQGGNYEFAMAKAESEKEISFKDFDDVTASIVKWPMSVIRLSAKDDVRLVELADKILLKWRSYTDADAFVFAETEGEPHNTITPIARKRGENFELDLVLRNNITTEEHPFGVYHPHSELHNIKKENIGLIEVMGLAVLPARLKEELSDLADCLANNKEIPSDLSHHVAWVNEIKDRRKDLTADNAQSILEEEVGAVFSVVLEHAGVYKCTEEGRKLFVKFVDCVNE
ncbi:MAG: UDP-glucose--hexose-1-phosphate uridylyltransferase [Clostridia bacterium]